MNYTYAADLEKLALLKELATPAALIKAFYLKQSVSMRVVEASARIILAERSFKLGLMLTRCADTLCLKICLSCM